MPKNEGNFSGNRREDWETPQWLFDKLNKVFNFCIDLAANEANKKCDRFISAEDDFLVIDKKGLVPDHEWAWCNPPYGRNGCGRWIEEIFSVSNSVSLLPASVGAKWFSVIWEKAQAIDFLDKRLRFVGAPCTAQFDSCLVVKTGPKVLSLATNGHSERDVLETLRSIGNVATTKGIVPRTRQARVSYF